VLERELQHFKVKINTQTGHDSYEAWRESDHDDLVLAIALSLWFAERRTGRKAFEGYTGPTTSPTGIVVKKLSETLEEITVIPPTEEEIREQREGWTWNDVINGKIPW
jgi:hypothetical protein